MLRSEHVEAFALNGELAFQAGVFAARYGKSRPSIISILKEGLTADSTTYSVFL